MLAQELSLSCGAGSSAGSRALVGLAWLAGGFKVRLQRSCGFRVRFCLDAFPQLFDIAPANRSPESGDDMSQRVDELPL